ncbi:MAG: aminotransferase, partial [Gammaproteobacteria bacterium]|nr:aminotransferase [Gammaproteobacteria bacterium]
PDSGWLAHHLLEEAGVAVTPGRDFGDHDPERYLRFCYTAPVPRIQEGLERIAHFLKVWDPKR